MENLEDVEPVLEEQNTVWEDVLIDKLTAQEVMEYLAEKDELTREIFYQHYFEDKTLKEIADAYGIKESTVKNRLYRTLRELKGIKRFAFIVAILLLAALLAKPVYTLAEDMVSQIKKYSAEDIAEIVSRASFYRKYKKLIKNGMVSEDICININGENYFFEELEDMWISNPWLEDLNWDTNELESSTEEVDYYLPGD